MKTVKEIIEEIKLRAMATSHLEEVDSLFGVHFNEILQAHEIELSEKDKEIENLKHIDKCNNFRDCGLNCENCLLTYEIFKLEDELKIKDNDIKKLEDERETLEIKNYDERKKHRGEVEVLKDEIDTHKKGYKLLEINYNALENENEKLKKRELFKEDFKIEHYDCFDHNYNIGNINNLNFDSRYICKKCYQLINLKDNSKFDLLPSKEEK